MYHYIITISYDGSSWSGWQTQGRHVCLKPNTIQDNIELALAGIFGEPVRICGSGRTDAGVHALAQTADFFCKKQIKSKNFLSEINSALPETIRITSVRDVPEKFHSRKSAVSKTYAYFVSLSEKPDVFLAKYLYNPYLPPVSLAENSAEEPDIKKMLDAAKILCGTHDFSAFTTDKTEKSHVRTIMDISIDTETLSSGCKYLKMQFTGNGFLYNMVRILSGTLLETGYGKLTPKQVSSALKSRTRSNAGATLPSNALFLCSVEYPPYL